MLTMEEHENACAASHVSCVEDKLAKKVQVTILFCNFGNKIHVNMHSSTFLGNYLYILYNAHVHRM